MPNCIFFILFMFISEFSSINLRNSSKLQNDLYQYHIQTQLQCPSLTIEVKGKCVRSPTKSSPSFAINENSSVKEIRRDLNRYNSNLKKKTKKRDSKCSINYTLQNNVFIEDQPRTQKSHTCLSWMIEENGICVENPCSLWNIFQNRSSLQLFFQSFLNSHVCPIGSVLKNEECILVNHY